jgi:hypothetical protein
MFFGPVRLSSGDLNRKAGRKGSHSEIGCKGVKDAK